MKSKLEKQLRSFIDFDYSKRTIDRFHRWMISSDSAEEKESVKTWKQNRPSKLKFSYKEHREFETIDDDIAALEELLEKLDKDMEANATNSVKLREIMEQKEKAQADLDEKMDRWVYLNDLAERIEAQKSEK